MVSNMREMKDSGIEWICDIPKDWEIAFLSQVYSQVKNKNVGLQEENLLSLSYGNIVRKDINTSDGLLPDNFEGYNIVNEGDIVLRLTDLQNDQRSLRVGLVKEKGIITSAYITLRSRLKSNNTFMYYLLHSFDICKGFYGMGSGVRQGLTYDGIKAFKFIIPCDNEQQKIASHLDKKVALIDNIIEKTKQSIDEYKKYKQSLITETVTKGLNPDVKMKDSGIEWIGEIPEHWCMSKIKREFYNMDGKRQPIDASLRKREAEILYDYYGASGVIDRIDDYIYDEDLLLIGEDGANLVMRNLPIIYLAKGKFWVNNHAHVLKPKLNNSLIYMAYYLETIDLTDYITGSAQPKLSQANLNIIPVLVPPFEEQQKIVGFLESKVAYVDDLLIKKNHLISELEAYKKSLIYEVVTGKKEV